MTTITLPNGTVITTDTPEEAARTIKALEGAPLIQFHVPYVQRCVCDMYQPYTGTAVCPVHPIPGSTVVTASKAVAP